MFLLNGTPLGIDSPFTYNDTQYPSNWLRLASQEERAAIGITEVADAPWYDDRFYWGPSNPKDLASLQLQWSKQVDVSVWQILNPTDFMDSRKANDPNYQAPAEWLDWRSAIRSTASATKASIAACTTVEELIPVVIPQWPSDPSQQGDV